MSQKPKQKGKRKYKTRKIWPDKDDPHVIEIWKDRMPELRKAKKNIHVYEAMAKDLLEVYSIKATKEEVKTKISNLTKRFRLEKKLVGPTGGTPSTWIHYDAVNEIIGSHAMSNTDDLITESIDDDSILSNDETIQDNFEEYEIVVEDNTNNLSSSYGNESHESTNGTQESTYGEEESTSGTQERMNTSQESTSSRQPPQKRRKSNKDNLCQVLEDSNFNLKDYADRQIEKEAERNEILREYLTKKNEIYAENEQNKVEIAREKNRLLGHLINKLG